MTLSTIVFAALALLLLAVTFLERRLGSAVTVTGLFDQLMADRTRRISVLVLWWWLGWHFLAGVTL